MPGEPDPSVEPRPDDPPTTTSEPNASRPDPGPAQPPIRPRPPVKTTGGPGGVLKGILASHNRVRAKHCVPALKWSNKLAAYAQDWANKLRNNNCAFNHRPRNPYGENLSMYGPPGGTNANEITMGWYNEIKDYKFDRPSFAFKTGHFTQVVWRGTTHLGCGRAVCPGAEIWVCNYGPPGNVQGDFPRNVPRPCK